MKRSLMLMALWVAGTVSAAQLTVAGTLAMVAVTRSDLAAAVARMNDAVPSRLVVRGIPLRAGWEKDAYWQAPAEKQRVLKAELTAAWADFARQLPRAGVEIDPAFFRRYRITDAPVFVLEGDEANEGCEGNRPAVVVRGNVTAGYAVREMRRSLTDEPGADSSLKEVLRRLEGLNVW